MQFFGLPDSCLSASVSWSWHILWCWSVECVSSISNDVYGYYCSKTNHYFSWANLSGSFQECWRSTNVTAIPKGALSPDRENYHLISITNILSKVYEKLVSHKFSSLCKKCGFYLLVSLLIGRSGLHWCAANRISSNSEVIRYRDGVLYCSARF